ncbi:hypothetical protein [Calothrix sp. PCC 7507]|uniref:hypothetical protein n=1 Tax=Calothrix sp. PCC 7507 TaxID=99598 RepID=UPI00029F0452|nr:hypothetical protein [Calothrix sp. PCC 7507]AFY35554.1 hypothetical protein Cal7507_5213 [Calothrix sp. PCC 7507]
MRSLYRPRLEFPIEPKTYNRWDILTQPTPIMVIWETVTVTFHFPKSQEILANAIPNFSQRNPSHYR